MPPGPTTLAIDPLNALAHLIQIAQRHPAHTLGPGVVLVGKGMHGGEEALIW